MASKIKTRETESESVRHSVPQPTSQASPNLTRQFHPAPAPHRVAIAPHSTLRPADILAVQQTLGNRVVQRFLAGRAQRQVQTEGELQEKPAIQRRFSEGGATAGTQQENKTGLPDALKAGIENLSGLTMDDVRVHYNSSQPAQLQALAYTQGTEIHIGPGQEQYLPHEAWHVVQQKQGRVMPTLQNSGTSINDNDVLEREADVMGTRAADRQLAKRPLHQFALEVSEASSGGSKSEYKTYSPTESATLQRKMKIAATGEVFDKVEDANKSVGQDCTSLTIPITSTDQYTVKKAGDLSDLASGKVADVLLPRKHVIGEIHTASNFDRIRGEWRDVQAMGEGHYTVKESSLALPAERGELHSNFERVMQSIGSDVLPLENYHAAAYGRLVSYLVLWNSLQDKPTDEVKSTLARRTSDIVELIQAYLTVSGGAFIRGAEDQKWYHIFPNYQGNIEKSYGEMYNLLTTNDAKAAIELLKTIDKSRDFSVIRESEFTIVRNFISDLFPAIGKILKISMTGKPGADQVIREADTISNYFMTNIMSPLGMQTALDKVNPTRERFMKEQIESLGKPALIKVGNAHIQGLRRLSIPDIALYYDAADFDAELRKRASDL